MINNNNARLKHLKPGGSTPHQFGLGEEGATMGGGKMGGREIPGIRGGVGVHGEKSRG